MAFDVPCNAWKSENWWKGTCVRGDECPGCGLDVDTMTHIVADDDGGRRNDGR